MTQCSVVIAAAAAIAGGLFQPAFAQTAAVAAAERANVVQEAEDALLVAVARAETAADVGTLARALRDLAIFYHTQNRLSEARQLHERALAVRERAFGRTHADVLQSLGDLALLAVAESRLEEATRLYSRVLRAERQIHGRDDLRTAIAVNNLALTYARSGKPGRAVRLYREELAMLEAAYGTSSVRLVSSLETLAKLEVERGETAAAEALFRRAISIAESDNTPAASRRLLSAVESYAALLTTLPQRRAEADSLLVRAETIRAANPGADRRLEE
jgi:tetratricopeptide (TPR) repeat protein